MTSRSRYDEDEAPRKRPVAAPAEEVIEEYEDLGPADQDFVEQDEAEQDLIDADFEDEEEVAPEPAVTAPTQPAQASKTVVRPQPNTARATAPAPAKQQRSPQLTNQRPAARTAPRPVTRSSRISQPVGARKPAQRNLPWIPIAITGVLLLILIGVIVVSQMNANSSDPNNTGNGPSGLIVATVDNSPIYQGEYDDRVSRDKATMLNDPMTGALLNNFEGITGTRALNVVKYDALDKLINLEVIRQQAGKEGVSPTPEQQQQWITQAKQSDLADSQYANFADFLKAHNISEAQYDKSVVTNVIYTAMAGKHMPATGSDEVKQDGFISWICDTRKSYSVNIIIKIDSANNQPCTSGLPSDIPITGIPTAEPDTGVPVPTGPAGTIVVAPQLQSLPEGEPTKAGTITTP